jgi:CRISPR-associated endonuclease Cas3-HD
MRKLVAPVWFDDPEFYETPYRLESVACRQGVQMWAHSANGAGQRHALVDHLHGTARLARQFAEPFGGGAAAFFAGLAHDAGKASRSWQQGLLRAEAARSRVGVDHKTLGVHLAGARRVGLLQLALHGHHGGLTNSEVVQCDLRDNDDVEDRRRRAEAEGPCVTSFPSYLVPHRSACQEGFSIRWSRSS